MRGDAARRGLAAARPDGPRLERGSSALRLLDLLS